MIASQFCTHDGSGTCPTCGRGNLRPRVKRVCRTPGPELPPLEHWRYITTDQLVADALSLVPRLPPLARVVGIARSGLIPAAAIAANVGAELWSIDQNSLSLLDLGTGTRMRGTEVAGETLIVDDSTWTGRALAATTATVAEAFSTRPLRLAVYAGRAVPDETIVARRLSNHWFEWNVANAPFVDALGWDLDGVFCRDFTAEEDDDGPRYLETLVSMRPTHIRPRKPVTIISARLERYREPTLDWLARAGIPVDRLVLGPWSTKAEREADNVAAWKARQVQALRLGLFVESDVRIARGIAEAASVPVIALDVREVIPPRRHEAPTPRAKIDVSTCIHRGEVLEQITCRGCGGEREVDVYACAVHGRCHLEPANDHRAGLSCLACALADEGFMA